MNKKEQAVAWLKEEIRSLERAPELNGCHMTPEWAAQLEIMRTCLEAVQDHFPDTTKMVPLTLEQLREMVDKPAYLYIYCRGWLDHMTDPPLPECLACPDHVDKAEWDRQKFYDEEE